MIFQMYNLYGLFYVYRIRFWYNFVCSSAKESFYVNGGTLPLIIGSFIIVKVLLL